ncbi:MAG: hypothetical protein JWN63_1097 [Candidatus Acidoferrum typicum]|nr:hypothetical protein [Candidatus Acidoferrum typicum]
MSSRLAARGSRAAGRDASGAEGANLLGQAHLDHVTGFAAFDQAQSALVDEAGTTRNPGNGKAEAGLPFEATVPQKRRIDGAVDDREAQARDEKILELFPDVFGVGLFVFHRQIQSGNFGKEVNSRQLTVHRQKKEQRFNAESTESGAQRSLRKKKKQIPRYRGWDLGRAGSAKR